MEVGEERFWINESNFTSILDAVRLHDMVELTFDDSNVSDYDVAFRALTERGMRATFFVIAGRMGVEGSMSRPQIREMFESGMGIGSHGMDHVPWCGLLSAEQRYRELTLPALLLEEVTGGPVRRAACPRGAYDRAALGSLRASGYEAVFTVDGGASARGAWLRDRYTVTRHDTAESIRRYLVQPGGSRSARLIRSAKRGVKRWR